MIVAEQQTEDCRKGQNEGFHPLFGVVFLLFPKDLPAGLVGSRGDCSLQIYGELIFRYLRCALFFFAVCVHAVREGEEYI